MRITALALTSILLAGCNRQQTADAPARAPTGTFIHKKKPDADLAKHLLQGLASSRKTTPDEQKAIAHALVAAKVIGKPFVREDYSSFYTPLSDIELFGRKVLAVEYEYIEEWIGCCVTNGFAVLLPNTPGDDAALDRFARENNCKVRVGKDVIYVPGAWDSQNEAGKFIQLSCKDSDSYAEEGSEE
ncbi:hypothetical protein [Vitiosangium sp. GDMCC 1.1324]|uniref:hypothetical protein n=1 Tax=Vitiosangium sp. (strain GDMCC 1.1324) TaxID=2138576 RepID=UPI000D36AF27|nr:hypothetical protein [Vitiosangium sp. GDMCC 1.1324]PTL76717.1 hypothetical protein DAT35_48175 [Vitiosangium sp. GDMCC 1.1324]